MGDEVHMHCTGVGKALLSQLSDQELDSILEHAGLPQFTPNTIVDVETLKHDLTVTRQRGYAIDNEEHEIDSYCIGVPIFDDRSQVVAACSLSGTDPEILSSRCQKLSSHLLQTAEEISRRMGYVPSRKSMVHHNDY